MALTQEQKNVRAGFEAVGADIKRLEANAPVNVLHPRFGAKGDGVTDDTAAIQAAINYAKTLGGLYKRSAVYFPARTYIVRTTLDCTDSNGLCLIGEGGRYQNSELRGQTGGLTTDFTGSTLSGLFNISITSVNGDPAPSTIGVQFALSKDANGIQKGGLNCHLTNVSILLANLPLANGGLGTIPVLNCRSEEFSATAIFTRGNTGFVFTNRLDLQPHTGYNLTVASAYAAVQNDANGSMGVIKIYGQVQCWEQNSPAFLLNGVNGLQFHGYIGRPFITPGANRTYESAFMFTQQTYGIQIHGTVESFSQVAHFQNNFDNVNINVTVANQTAPNTPVLLFDKDFMTARNLTFDVAFGNPSEMANRFLLYADSNNTGNSPISSSLLNSRISCAAWADNTLMMPLNLMRNVSNTTFNVGQPYEVKGGYVKQLFVNPVSAGTLGNATAAQIIRFQRADRNTRTSGNAGSYDIKVRGTVTVGSYDSGARAICDFESTINYVQNFNGGGGTTTVNTVLVNNCSNNGGGITISGVTVSLDINDAVNGRITVLPNVGGANVGEPIQVDALTEIKANFAVNSTVLFA